MEGLSELKVFESTRRPHSSSDPDTPSKPTFPTKKGRQWVDDLVASGFDPTVPTVWLLEGLLMYLSLPDTVDLMTQIGELPAANSVVFHDAISASYVERQI